MPNFSDRLKALRIEKGLTQKELANLLHVSQNAIHNWETGKREPKIETIERIAAALKVDYSQLIGMEEIPITKDLITKRPDIREALTQGMLEVFGTSADERLIELIKNDNSDKVINVFNSLIKRVSINEKYHQLQINLVDVDIDNINKECLLKNFDKLNSIGKDEAIKRVAELTEIPRYIEKETSLPPVNAAHAITESSEEDKQHDEDIMNDENF